MAKANFLTVATVALFVLAACDGPSSQDRQSIDLSGDATDEIANLPDRLDTDRKVDVVASVESYSDQGWRDHYNDGSYAFYKISVLRIIEPMQYAGESLNISFGESPDPDSHWRRVDTVIRFRIAADVMDVAAGESAIVGEGFVEITDVMEGPAE